ncbi:protein of unknown function [Magnetospirillum sp. XM-1]|nr:protein of unknown function [Magnetospirillum sp. XM-1]
MLGGSSYERGGSAVAVDELQSSLRERVPSPAGLGLAVGRRAKYLPADLTASRIAVK